jgi:hypothetical protein
VEGQAREEEDVKPLPEGNNHIRLEILFTFAKLFFKGLKSVP